MPLGRRIAFLVCMIPSFAAGLTIHNDPSRVQEVPPGSIIPASASTTPGPSREAVDLLLLRRDTSLTIPSCASSCLSQYASQDTHCSNDISCQCVSSSTIYQAAYFCIYFACNETIRGTVQDSWDNYCSSVVNAGVATVAASTTPAGTGTTAAVTTAGSSTGQATVTVTKSPGSDALVPTTFPSSSATNSPASSSDGPSSASSGSGSGSSSLSAGAIAGIAVGSAGGAILLCLILFLLYRRARAKTASPAGASGTINTTDPGAAGKPELDSTPKTNATSSASPVSALTNDPAVASRDANALSGSPAGGVQQQSQYLYPGGDATELPGLFRQQEGVYHEAPGQTGAVSEVAGDAPQRSHELASQQFDHGPYEMLGSGTHG